MSISIAIMAHPKRKRWIPGLVQALDGNPRIVWDENNDRWDTGRRSLLAYDPQATHHLVIQDDGVPCRDLLPALGRIVTVTKQQPVCAYMGKNPRYREGVERARSTGACFVEAFGPWWGVAILLPVPHIQQIVDYGDSRADLENYDKRIGSWYAQNGMKCLYTLPSLVEHRHGGGNPSLIAKRTGTMRRAWDFIGVSKSALDVNWSGPIYRVTPSYPKSRPSSSGPRRSQPSSGYRKPIRRRGR